jgi:predicted alpha/beta hydrolase family esterase
MENQILFIQGAGDVGYEGDVKLVTSLQKALGTDYKVHYPEMPTDEVPYFGSGWVKQIGEELSAIDGTIILAGHSLGASMLLKYLSEQQTKKDISGIFLIAAPFWKGDEDWRQPLKLQEDFAQKLPKEIPIFFYQCKDDDVVPFDHFTIYKQNIPWAVFREMPHGGHQLNDDLSEVANDIRSLSKGHLSNALTTNQQSINTLKIKLL